MNTVRELRELVTELRSVHRVAHRHEPTEISLTPAAEALLLTASPKELGDPLFRKVLENGRRAFPRLQGLRVHWDAPEIRVFGLNEN